MDSQSIIFVVLFNIALYIFLTGVCFISSRPPRFLQSKRWTGTVFKPLSPKETIAACFCGPAKSTALGIPLLYAMWAPLDLYLQAQTSVPVLLYTTEQICVAHFFVQLFKRWHAHVEKQEGESIGDPEIDLEEGLAGNEASDAGEHRSK